MLQATFRNGTDDVMVRHTSFLFAHLEPEIKSVISSDSMKELCFRFARGTLDRELTEKVKVADGYMDVHEYRFVQAVTSYIGRDVEVSTAEVELRKLQSDLDLDLVWLATEGKQWATYLSELRTFHAETQNDRTEELEVQAH